MNSRDSRRRSAGFSLIELFVATGAMLFVIFFTLGTFTINHQTYVVVDQIAEAQQNTRSIATLIERDVRNAGYLVEPQASACGLDNTGAADVLFLSDADAIRPVDQLPIGLRGSSLGAETNTAAPTAAGVLTVTVDDVVIDGQPSYDTDGDGTDDSDFRVGAGAILIDLTTTGRGVACGLVTSVTPPSTVEVSFLNGLATATLPADLRLIAAHSYQLVTPGGGAPPRLQRDGVMLAKDVEDLQVAWFYDANDNGQVDANEYQGGSGTVYDNTLVDGNDLREVRVSLVVRTSADDPRNLSAAGTGQAIENRTGSVAGNDGRHRRVHQSTIRVRNVAS